jgi:CheY-like chemotaxis protein
MNSREGNADVKADVSETKTFLQKVLMITDPTSLRDGTEVHASKVDISREVELVRCDQVGLAGGDETNVKAVEVVVVVEDEDALRDVICEGLRNEGYEAYGVANSKEALRLMLEHKSRAVMLVTDLVLHEDGGWPLARWTRERFPHLPILFMSGWIDESAVRSALAQGNAAFLQKPFSLTSLVDSLRTLAERHEPSSLI